MWAGVGQADSVPVEIERIADLVTEHVPSQHRVLVGIDGVDASGNSTFAAALARSISSRPVVVVHLDDFLNPSSVRHRRGRHSPEGFWLDTYNYEAIHTNVLEPLRASGHGRYRAASYEPGSDQTVLAPERQAADDALVLIEGMFVHRDELRDLWDYSIFLDVPFNETARRTGERDGSHPDPEHESMRRYVGGQQLYFTAAHPWERASLVIDNSTPTHPRVIPPQATAAASE